MFEQMGGFFTPLYRGATIVYPRTLKPSAIMEALGEEDVHAMIAVPRLLQLLKSSVERELAEKHLTGLFHTAFPVWQKNFHRRSAHFFFIPFAGNSAATSISWCRGARRWIRRPSLSGTDSGSLFWKVTA